METKTILLVEDNADDETLTLRALRKANVECHVSVAHDGVEALEYLFGNHTSTRSKPHPNLILLDLKMPRIDGLELLRRLRADERTRLVPVVVLTSSDEEKDLIDAYALGANSYVRKPVDFVEFAESVRQLAQYWLACNRGPPAGRRQPAPGPGFAY